MSPHALTTADLEAVYDALAQAIDRAGEERSKLYLAKLALLLAQAVGDRARVLEAVAAAGIDL